MAVDATNTVERVRAALAAVLRVPVERVVPEARLTDLVEIDSLTLAEVATALDDEFHIRLPSDDLSAVQTVADLVRLVERTPPGASS